MNLTDHSLAVLDNMRRTGEVFRMAALLHDISKYQKFEVKDNGEFSYHGHDKESAKMSVSILKRLKWSSEDIERVEKMISCHMILKPFRDQLLIPFLYQEILQKSLLILETCFQRIQQQQF